MATEFFTPEYLADLAADGFTPAPRRPVVLAPDDFFTPEYVQAVLEDLAAEGEGGPDGPAPSPAAPAVRPVALCLVAAGAGPAWVELSPEEEAALADFEQAAAKTWDPEPCVMCGRVASPGVETDEGVLLCFPCAEAAPSARSAVRTWRFAATCRRLAAARLGRTLAGVS